MVEVEQFAELPQEAENELRTTQDLNKKIVEQKNEIVQLKRVQPKIDPEFEEVTEGEGDRRGRDKRRLGTPCRFACRIEQEH